VVETVEKPNPRDFPTVSPALGKSRKGRGISHIPTGNRGWINYFNLRPTSEVKLKNPT